MKNKTASRKHSLFLRFSNGKQKHLQKAVVSKYLKNEMIDMPKLGLNAKKTSASFHIKVMEWLKRHQLVETVTEGADQGSLSVSWWPAKETARETKRVTSCMEVNIHTHSLLSNITHNI